MINETTDEKPSKAFEEDLSEINTFSSEGEEEPLLKDIYKEELEIIKSLEIPSLLEINGKSVDLGPSSKPRTVVLDLDETLIHASSRINIYQKEEFEISVRPYCKTMLQALSEDFEIIVFTAATEEYAEKVLNLIDPDRIFIKALLSRQHCCLTKDGYFIKDLRILSGRDLNKTVIVDNSVISFAFQLENGIPIEPFFGDPDDQELIFLEEYLKGLSKEADMKIVNSRTMKLIQAFLGQLYYITEGKLIINVLYRRLSRLLFIVWQNSTNYPSSNLPYEYNVVFINIEDIIKLLYYKYIL